MTEEIIEHDEAFLEYLKRPANLNKKKIEGLIEDIEQVIENIKVKIRNSHSRMEKNMYYQQIENRQSQIKYWSKFL